MVYVDDKDLGHKPYYERWAKSKEDLGEAVPDVLMILYNRYIDKLIRRIIEGATDDEILAPLSQATPRTGLNLVKQLCTMIDLMLPTENTPQEPDLLENMYIFCIVWSLGGTLNAESRAPFEEYLKTLAERMLPPTSLYNHYYDRDTRNWPTWDIKV
jgi:dynein heavy chain